MAHESPEKAQPQEPMSILDNTLADQNFILLQAQMIEGSGMEAEQWIKKYSSKAREIFNADEELKRLLVEGTLDQADEYLNAKLYD